MKLKLTIDKWTFNFNFLSSLNCSAIHLTVQTVVQIILQFKL